VPPIGYRIDVSTDEDSDDDFTVFAVQSATWLIAANILLCQLVPIGTEDEQEHQAALDELVKLNWRLLERSPDDEEEDDEEEEEEDVNRN
jgi:hypothetical protein